MPSNSLTTIRAIVPRPAVCKSNRKLFPYNMQDWNIPNELQLTIEFGGGSGTPPEWFLTLHRRPRRATNSLDYATSILLPGWNVVMRFNFDPLLGQWLVYFDMIHSPQIIVSFIEKNIP